MPTLSVYPAADSFMRSGSYKDTNFNGASIVMGTTFGGGSKAYADRPIANFDVSVLTGAHILSAKLVRVLTTLYKNPAAKIYRCTRPATWVEASVTWNKYDGSHAWTAEGGDLDLATPAPVAFVEPAAEITGLGDFVVDALANRSGIVSIIMHNDDESNDTGYSAWHAKEGFTDIWRLDVDYGDVVDLGRRSAIDTHMGEQRPRRPSAGSSGRRPLQPTNPRGAHRP